MVQSDLEIISRIVLHLIHKLLQSCGNISRDSMCSQIDLNQFVASALHNKKVYLTGNIIRKHEITEKVCLKK